MPKIIKITKHFQGGQKVYFAILPNAMKLTKGGWRRQLELWGETTPGGFSGGYEISVSRVKRRPRIARWVFVNKPFDKRVVRRNGTKVCPKLKFDPSLLERK
jgi:hypothetical protein